MKTNKKLDKVVTEEDKFNWKQWIPGYGLYHVLKDFEKGKQIMLPDKTWEKTDILRKHLLINDWIIAYHNFLTGAAIIGTAYGLKELYPLIEKLF